MGVKIKNLPDLSGLPEQGDYFVVTDESVTSKVDFSAVAEAILNDYTLTLGGIDRTVKQALDANTQTVIDHAVTLLLIQQALANVETTDVAFSSAFSNYSSGANPHFYKYGKVAMVYGTAKPSATITGGTDLVEMFDFPSGYTPAGRLIQMQQASGQRLWTLTLQNGKAYFSRCRSGDTWYSATTSEWLPFNAVYICE